MSPDKKKRRKTTGEPKIYIGGTVETYARILLDRINKDNEGCDSWTIQGLIEAEAKRRGYSIDGAKRKAREARK